MRPDTQLLVESVEKRIVYYKKKRSESRIINISVRILAIVLSTATTLMLGIKGYVPQYEKALSIAAIATSASLAALTTWEAFADNAGRWVRRKQLLSGLYDIRHELRYQLTQGDDLAPDLVEQLYRRFVTIMQGEDWQTKRAQAITAPFAGRAVL